MAKVGTSAIESRKLGYLLDGDVIVAAQGRTAVRRDRRRPRRWPTAATGRREGALFPVAGRNGHGHHQGPARQHARRRLHQRARLPHRAR
ncbi:MAG: hypothetical protein MZW92_62760 [Comamonadaceae bacterium]|nr:hypothetical protein [Comamonadaceae bacterium]